MIVRDSIDNGNGQEWSGDAGDEELMMMIIGAVTHTTVNGFSHGKFSRGTSHLGF